MNGDTARTFKKFVVRDLQNYTMVIALAVIWAAFEVITKGVFLSARNISLLARQTSITGVLTIGAVMLIISGNFDISTGSVLGLTGGVAAILQVWFKLGTPLAILSAIAVGVVIGAWQGFWASYKRVPSFIVTLGGLMIFRGVLLVLTQGKTIAPLRPNFKILGGGFIPKTYGYVILIAAIAVFAMITLLMRMNRKQFNFSVRSLASTVALILFFSLLMGVFVYALNSYQGIPLPVIIMLVLVIIFSFVMNRTTFGRRIYAIGGNREAASLSGIKVERNVFSLFLIMAGLSALAGVLMTARMNAAAPTAGTGMELDAIAAAVLGGTSLSGGYGTVTGGIIGALIMATLDNGMSLFNISSYYQFIVKGLILVLAVWFDVSIKKK